MLRNRRPPINARKRLPYSPTSFLESINNTKLVIFCEFLYCSPSPTRQNTWLTSPGDALNTQLKPKVVDFDQQSIVVEETNQKSDSNSFRELNLSEEILAAISKLGYERPSPIQAKTIPPLLEGKDILGQAQTGTGKTASFALPILSQLQVEKKTPQALVLTPTRELAIQVAEAFQKYASQFPKFKVLPIYGGSEYEYQLKNLKRGTHVVVGTPGRVMDHMRRGTLKLQGLKTFVLDEADEMLKMGFIDDIQWIMDSLPEKKQLALFSATMPSAVKRIANSYLVDPVAVHIESKTSTADTVRQRYCSVKGPQKLEALTRILEVEPIQAGIVFVRTKSSTVELADKLKARGFSTAALNGDIDQRQREKTVTRLRNGSLDLLVATDVAARGLDVERVSHVFNFDIPFGTEAYVHRIGRTGRAGRQGDAILFVTPRETRMLKTIEKATKGKIEKMEMPSQDEISNKRKSEFKKRITKALGEKERKRDRRLVEEFLEENQEVDLTTLATVLAKLAYKAPPAVPEETTSFDSDSSPRGRGPKGRGRSSDRKSARRPDRSSRTPDAKKLGKKKKKKDSNSKKSSEGSKRPTSKKKKETKGKTDKGKKKKRKAN